MVSIDKHSHRRRTLHLPTGDAADIVVRFKKLTDENRAVADILRMQFDGFSMAPILDVGAGTGDIALRAWAKHDVTLLDIAAYQGQRISSCHNRVQRDFFDPSWPTTNKHWNTMLFSHVLQYLDDDARLLLERILDFSPKFLITVTNDNSDPTMRRIIDFAQDHIGDINAEVDDYDFTPAYQLQKTAKFNSAIQSQSFEELATGFYAVVFDRILNPNETALAARHLQTIAGKKPALAFQQFVKGYRYGPR